MRPSAQPACGPRTGLFWTGGAALLLALGCGGTARTLPTRPDPPLRLPLLLDDDVDDDVDAPTPPDDQAAELLGRHNRIRVERDLPPLSHSPKLAEAARGQVSGMIAMGKMTHKGADGSKLSERVEQAGYRYVSVGENVAFGQETAGEVMDGWMDSPGHRRNILGEFAEMGAARGEDEEGTPYWCVVFGSPLPRLDPGEAAEDLRSRINMLRNENELPPLTADPILMEIAGDRSRAMAEADSLEPGGEPLGELLGEEGVRFRNASRLVSSGTPEASGVFRSIEEDEGRRGLLLGSFDRIGIGYATSEESGRPYWTVLLVERGEDEAR